MKVWRQRTLCVAVIVSHLRLLQTSTINASAADHDHLHSHLQKLGVPSAILGSESSSPDDQRRTIVPPERGLEVGGSWVKEEDNTALQVPYRSDSLHPTCTCTKASTCVSDDLGSSYRVYGLFPKTNLKDLIEYVDHQVCADGELRRVGIETAEELNFLVSCLLCNPDSIFGSSKNKTNILTSGVVNVLTPFFTPSEAMKQGVWSQWNTSMKETLVASEVVLVDPTTGEAVPNHQPVPIGTYALLLMGNYEQICNREGTTYRRWGLLDYGTTGYGLFLTGHALCETHLQASTTTTTTTSSTTTMNTDPSISTSTTTTTTPTPTTTTTSAGTTTTTVIINDGCCHVQEHHVSRGYRDQRVLCPGKQLEVNCPTGYSGFRWLECVATDGGPILTVDKDSCIVFWIHTAQDMVESGNYSAVAISAGIRNSTAQRQVMTRNDLIALTSLINNMTSLLQIQILEEDKEEERLSMALNYTDDLVAITGNVLSVPDTWNGLNQKDAGQLGSSLLINLECSGFILADQVKRDVVTFLDAQVNMTVLSSPRNELSGNDLYFPGAGESTFLHLPGGFESLLPKGEEQARLVGFLLDQQAASRALPAHLSRDVSHATYKELNSPVVSMSLGRSGHAVSFTPLDEGVLLRLQHTISESGPAYRDLYRDLRPGELPTPVPGTAQCVFWDNENSEWAPDGCKLVNTTKGLTFCRCSHLTMIAIITDFHNNVGRDPALDILGTVLTGASCVSLFIAFCIFQCYKSVASPRTSITKQLCVALGLSHLLLLLLLDRDFLKLSSTMCEVAAVVLHYWVTASVCWMLAEGAHLFQTVHHVLSPTRYMAAYWMVGYGVPVVVVMVTLLVAYGTDSWTAQLAYAPPGSEYCWLSTERGYIWAFIGPMVVVIVVNALSMILAVRSAAILKANKQKSLPQQVKLWIKGCFSLNCLLGTSWVFGLLYVNTGHFFAYLFTILNASQGVMILVLHCLVNDSVRSAVIASLPPGISKYLGVKPTKNSPVSSATMVRRRSTLHHRPTSIATLSLDLHHTSNARHYHHHHHDSGGEFCVNDRQFIANNSFCQLCSSDRQLCSSDRQLCSKDCHRSSSDRQLCSKDYHRSSSDRQLCSDDRQLCSSDRQLCSKDYHRSSSDRQICSDDRQLCSNNRQFCSSDRQLPSTNYQSRFANDRQGTHSPVQRSDLGHNRRMTTSASRTFPGVNRRNSKVRESWKTLATAASSPHVCRNRYNYRVSPSPMKVSPQITHRAVRAGSQWSTVTQFSFISDGISSDSSSGRRISFESFESYTSEESSTAPILPLASRPSGDTFRAYLTPPETPPEVSRRHGYVLESGSHDNPCCVPESGAHDKPCCVPDSAHDNPCCVPESGAHDDPCCVPDSAHDKPCCVPESGAHDDPCCVPESAHDKPCCVPESAGQDTPRYTPEFDTIIECDERSPRVENATTFFQ